jgi:hypothetical protein
MSSLDALAQANVRRQTTLWLRGTGANAWPYYGFFERFSLDELAQFDRIVAASGGAAVFWVYVLSQVGHFDTSTVDRYDRILRGALNRGSIWQRLGRVLCRRSPYKASEHLELLRAIVSEEAFGWTLAQFPLSNFRVLTAEGQDRYREFGEREEDRLIHLASLIAIGGTRATGQDLETPGVSGDHFDFEYASAVVRRSYKDDLARRSKSVLVLNTRVQSNDGAGSVQYLRLSRDRHPALMQLYDALLLFLNLPNDRYTRVFHQSRGE